MRVLIGAALAAIIAASGGCGGSIPTERDGENALVREFTVAPIKVVRFRKTDGVSSEPGGIKMYEMKYEAEIEYLEDWVGTRYQRLAVGDTAISELMKSGARGSRLKG